MFLMETKLCSSKMEIIRTKVGFDNMFTVDCSGRSGGLALLWKKELNLTIVNHSRNFIDATINSVSSSSLWRYTGFYGCPERHRHVESWDLLKQLSLNNSLPWILMGDFNDLLSHGEKLGGAPHPNWLIQGFQETVNFSGLFDLTFKGY